MGEHILKELSGERRELQRLLLHEPAGPRRWLRWFRSADGDAVLDSEQLSDRDRRVLRDPEVRKNIEILAARIADAIDRQPRTPPLPEATTNRIAELVGEARGALGLENLLDTWAAPHPRTGAGIQLAGRDLGGQGDLLWGGKRLPGQRLAAKRSATSTPTLIRPLPLFLERVLHNVTPMRCFFMDEP